MNCRQTGFTLIELVISVALIGILAYMAVPLLEVTQQRQKEIALRSALRQIRQAIDAYHQAAREQRIDTAADASGYPPNLDVLEQGVADITQPDSAKIYFLRRLPRDPLHPDATVKAAATWGTRSYKSPPDAPRAGDDVFDVYSLSMANGLNGVPYRQW